MKHLLDFAAKPDDESLHVAARLTKASLVKLLLDHGASVNSPGIYTCDYRTPLGELCRRSNPLKDPAQVKDTLNLFAEAQPDFAKLSNNKFLVFLALDNDLPFAMTTALLKPFDSCGKTSMPTSTSFANRAGPATASPRTSDTSNAGIPRPSTANVGAATLILVPPQPWRSFCENSGVVMDSGLTQPAPTSRQACAALQLT